MFSSFTSKSLVLCLSLFSVISCSGETDDTHTAIDHPTGVTNTGLTSGVITLNWTPPTENTDKSTLLDLSGYKIYYGEAENALNSTITVSNSSLSTYVIENLQPGNVYYVSITSYNSNGTESIMSNISTVIL